jgi:hypothetical protein
VARPSDDGGGGSTGGGTGGAGTDGDGSGGNGSTDGPSDGGSFGVVTPPAPSGLVDVIVGDVAGFYLGG